MNWRDQIKSVPKEKVIRLTGNAYKRLKEKRYEVSKGCCEVCGVPVLLNDEDGSFNVLKHAHLSHIISRGAGGSDILSNVLIKCPKCHRKEHGTRFSKGE